MIDLSHHLQRFQNGYDKNIFLLRRGLQALRRQGFYYFYSKFRYHYRRYERWILQNEIAPADANRLEAEINALQNQLTLSIIMPVYNVPARWLKRAIASVRSQHYKNWELCIADDCSTQSHVQKILKHYAQADPRIKVKFLKKNIGISGASNQALAMASGKYVGLLDNDDEISVNALFEVVKLINQYPDADLIYSDEDKLALNHKRCEPFFKPDWSPDMLLSCMYTGHFSVYRKQIVDHIGGFRMGFEGSQDYDLALRFTEKTDQIFHIPKILYHWRKIPGSLAFKENSKTYAYDAAQRVLAEALDRRGIRGRVKKGQWLGSYRIQYEIVDHRKISIIILTKDQLGLLKKCLDSLLNRNTYPLYEIIIVNNNSVKRETAEYLTQMAADPRISVLNDNRDFNFAALNNRAVQYCGGEVLLFLNNDCQLKEKDSLGAMVEHIQRKEVGAVGAKLIYGDDTIQHCGVILGLGAHRAAGHHSYQFPADNHGYFGRNSIIHNVSAVTAAAMMTTQSRFNEVGGFDEQFKQAYNDVDFCLKLRQKGHLIVYTPYAVFYHHESATRGYADTPEKTLRFKKEVSYFKLKWEKVLKFGDPYYNYNLSLEREDFSVRLVSDKKQ